MIPRLLFLIIGTLYKKGKSRSFNALKSIRLEHLLAETYYTEWDKIAVKLKPISIFSRTIEIGL